MVAWSPPNQPRGFGSQGGSALEDESASVLWRGPMKLGDDMSEDVLAFDDRGVDAISVSSTGDGVAGEH
jgi:hypothetical protein